MDTNRLTAVLAAVMVLLVGALVVVPRLLRDRGHGDGAAVAVPRDVQPRVADRALAPVVEGRVLDDVAPQDRPPAPVQWGEGRAPIPSSTWWSSAVTGPGADSLWPQPLGLKISAQGEVQVADPSREVRPDGWSEAPFVPALFLEPSGMGRTRVVGHGPLHVRLRLDGGGHHRELTLVQGSPFVELQTDAPLELRVPGLEVDAPAGSVPALRFGTAEGEWLVAGADPVLVTAAADRLTVRPGPSGRVVLGPVPADVADTYDATATSVATHPVQATSERVAVADDGTTTQVLAVDRGAGTPSVWALQPHHQRYGVDLPTVLGTVPSADGDLPVVTALHLELQFPPVPILWSAVPIPGGDPVPSAPAPLGEGNGSYFGGKAVYADASRSDLLRLDGQQEAALAALTDAAKVLDRLADSLGTPSLRWDQRWGSVLIEPAEFGSGTELNDHQLQYGYWVAAAAHVAEADPDAGRRYRSMIDLLVADYAGADTVPGAPSSLPGQRTWSPYEGHSWASGTQKFAAGNDLESVSESSLAWWAAARWMIASGRPALAEPFLARFTIETALTGQRWLPQGDALPTNPEARPWSGVVWSGKSDLDTWFDPKPESALGIRLLPLGPASLARYGSAAAVAAARTRWGWCDTRGGGCTSRWANLLDSDAVVAGRPPLTGPDPEPSTAAGVSAWWRDLWTRTEPVDGWSCSVGVVVRRDVADRSLVVLATNPGPQPVAQSCRDAAGNVRWHARTTGARAIPLD